MQAELQGVAQVGDIKDELLAWTDFMCSSSVRLGQALDPCAPLIPFSYLQVHQSWEMAGQEKEYSDKVRQDHEFVVESLLTTLQLQLTERVLLDTVARLRSALNRTRPVNKLPPEVLTRCFSHLTPCFSLTMGSSENQNEWIRVTHVCKHWMAVATGFSGLWDRVEFTRPEILRMYFEWSRSRQLEVCLQHVGPRFSQMVQPEAFSDVMFSWLRHVGSRVHSLLIHKDRLSRRHGCWVPAGSLPNLETLSITSNVGWENGSDDKPGAELMALFEDGVPPLLKLFIPECTPWPNNNFKNLKLLCLYNQSGLELELPELLQMLRGSPKIEELYLRQHESSDWLEVPPSVDLGPTFQARSLKKLRLHNFSDKAIVYILSTMQLHPNGVAVNISDTVMDADTFTRIIPLFPPGCTLGGTEKLEVFHHSGLGDFGIIFCCTGGSFKIGGYLTWPDKENEVDKAKAAIPLFKYIYQECAQTLKELWIHSSTTSGGGYVFDNFSCFNLEKLFLAVWEGKDVTNRLCEVLDPRGPGILDVPAPRLRSLTIQGIYEQSQLEQLIALCEGRSNTDHPLHQVSVCCWRDQPEWMARLCGSAPTPIYVNPNNKWEGQMMELPVACAEDAGPWWPGWGEGVAEIGGYGY